MIELWNVNKTYETGNKALRNINITVEDGEFVFIIGRSGSGKSTLLNALELGVYNHIAGDGREYVIADETREDAQALHSKIPQEAGHDIPGLPAVKGPQCL